MLLVLFCTLEIFSPENESEVFLLTSTWTSHALGMAFSEISVGGQFQFTFNY